MFVRDCPNAIEETEQASNRDLFRLVNVVTVIAACMFYISWGIYLCSVQSRAFKRRINAQVSAV